MSRDIDAALVTASTSQYFKFNIFAKLEFDAATIYIHNGIGPLSFGGNEYLGVGDFGGISVIEEGPEISPYGISLILSALDSTFLNTALTLDYYMRPITIYIGAINSSGALVADPDELWSGKMDTMDIVTGQVNTIQLNCESDLAIFDKINGKRYSDAQQQADYPGDLFFQFLDQMVDSNVPWRGQGGGVRTGGGGAPRRGEERRPGG